MPNGDLETLTEQFKEQGLDPDTTPDELLSSFQEKTGIQDREQAVRRLESLAGQPIPEDTLAGRMNNPGNLRFAGQPGAEEGERGFARFPTESQGFAALENQINKDKSRGFTLSEFINKYSPPSENPTAELVETYSNILETSPNTKITEIPTSELSQAITRVETGEDVTPPTSEFQQIRERLNIPSRFSDSEFISAYKERVFNNENVSTDKVIEDIKTRFPEANPISPGRAAKDTIESAQDGDTRPEDRTDFTVADYGSQLVNNIIQGVGGTTAATIKGVPAIAKAINDAMPEEVSNQSLAETNLTDMDLWQVGDSIESWVYRNAPTEEGLSENFWLNDVPRAIGSLLTFAAGGAAGRAVGVGGRVAAGTLGASAGATEGVTDVILESRKENRQLTDEEARKVEDSAEWDQTLNTLINAAGGVSEAFPVGRLLRRSMPRASMSVVKDAVSGFIEEFGQESFQTALRNLSAKDLVGFDPERDILEGVGREGAAGGVSGALFSALLSGVGKFRLRNRLEQEIGRRPTDEDLEDFAKAVGPEGSSEEVAAFIESRQQRGEQGEPVEDDTPVQRAIVDTETDVSDLNLGQLRALKQTHQEIGNIDLLERINQEMDTREQREVLDLNEEIQALQEGEDVQDQVQSKLEESDIDISNEQLFSGTPEEQVSRLRNLENSVNTEQFTTEIGDTQYRVDFNEEGITVESSRKAKGTDQDFAEITNKSANYGQVVEEFIINNPDQFQSQVEPTGFSSQEDFAEAITNPFQLAQRFQDSGEQIFSDRFQDLFGVPLNESRASNILNEQPDGDQTDVSEIDVEEIDLGDLTQLQQGTNAQNAVEIFSDESTQQARIGLKAAQLTNEASKRFELNPRDQDEIYNLATKVISQNPEINTDEFIGDIQESDQIQVEDVDQTTAEELNRKRGEYEDTLEEARRIRNEIQNTTDEQQQRQLQQNLSAVQNQLAGLRQEVLRLREDVGIRTGQIKQQFGGQNPSIQKAAARNPEFFEERQETPEWTQQEGETVEGSSIIQGIQEDRDGSTVGVRTITEYLINNLESIEQRIGNTGTTKRFPTIFDPGKRLIQTSVPHSELNFHEEGHGILILLEELAPINVESKISGVIELTTRENSRASNETIEEGFAEWVRLYIQNPGVVADMGVTEQIEQVLENNLEGVLPLLRDASRAYNAHHNRSVFAWWQSAKNDKGGDRGVFEKMKDGFHRTMFEHFDQQWPIDKFQRDIYNVFNEFGANEAEAQQQYQQLMDSLKDSDADIRQAYQWVTKIGVEAQRLFNGTDTDQGVSAIAFGNGQLLTNQEASNIIEGIAGREFEESEDAFAWAEENSDIDFGSLTDPETNHGNRVKFLPFSFAEIIRDVKETEGQVPENVTEGVPENIDLNDSWSPFEVYSQIKVSLDRYNKNGVPYTGWESKSQEELQDWVRQIEELNPEYEGIFEKMNQYFDSLLIMAVVAGDKTSTEARAMIDAYDFYVPLLRQTEDGGVQARKSGEGPAVDAMYRRLSESNIPLPPEPLLQAAYTRTRQVVDAVYTNHAMMAAVNMSDHIQNSSELPPAVRATAERTINVLNFTPEVVNRITPDDVREIAPKDALELIAEQKNQETLGSIREERGDDSLTMDDVPGEELIDADDVAVSWGGKDIWRQTPPKQVNVIAPKVNGEHIYVEINDPLLFDMFAKSDNPGEMMNFIFNDLLGSMTAPWKRLLTQNIVFAIRNAIGRDPFTASFFGIDPTISDKLSITQRAKQMVPGYFLVKGISELLTGGSTEARAASELLSRTMSSTMSPEHKARISDWQQVMEEGIVSDRFKSAPLTDKIALAPGIAMSALLKPFEILLHGTGQRSISQLGEEATRIGAYKALKDAGVSDAEAIRGYDTVTGNFGNRPGNPNTYALYRSAGFLNPAAQIFSEVVRRVVSPDARVQKDVALRMFAIASATAAVWAINQIITPDDRREELKERPDEDKLRYMPIGGYIRVPFDYGPVGAVQSFTFNMMDRLATERGPSNKEVANEVLKRLLDFPGGQPMQFVNPQILSILEAKANYSFFFGSQLEPPYMQYMAPEERAFYSTPKFYQFLADMTGWSPLKIEHVVRSGLSFQLDQAIELADKIERGQQVVPQEVDDLSQTQFIGRLFQEIPRSWQTKSVQDLNELSRQYTNLNNRLEALSEDGYVDQEKVQTLRRKMATLAPMHQAMLKVRNIYGTVKEMRDRNRHNEADALEEKMTEVAASALSNSGMFDDSGSGQFENSEERREFLGIEE